MPQPTQLQVFVEWTWNQSIWDQKQQRHLPSVRKSIEQVHRWCTLNIRCFVKATTVNL
uniref:Transposase n=1 Tax=Mesocestoides corti TaxID=53468 RepID=A0A5K3FG59_MESCO